MIFLIALNGISCTNQMEAQAIKKSFARKALKEQTETARITLDPLLCTKDMCRTCYATEEHVL